MATCQLYVEFQGLWVKIFKTRFVNNHSAFINLSASPTRKDASFFVPSSSSFIKTILTNHQILSFSTFPSNYSSFIKNHQIINSHLLTYQQIKSKKSLLFPSILLHHPLDTLFVVVGILLVLHFVLPPTIYTHVIFMFNYLYNLKFKFSK